MKKIIFMLCLSLASVMSSTACGSPALADSKSASASGTDITRTADIPTSEIVAAASETPDAVSQESPLPDGLFESYYAAQKTPVFEYMQHSSIQKFLSMWVKEETGDITNPKWDYDTFTAVSVLDHDLAVSRPDEPLYCLTFSDGADRYGYAIVKYQKAGPAIGNWSIAETTPHCYDLRANSEEISAALKKTDIDLATVTASRVYLLDKENNRADQVILFTDGKNEQYIYYFCDPSSAVEKWQAPQ